MDERKEALIRAFHNSLLQGENYARINQARKQAEDFLGESIPPGSPLTKVVDEAMEAAIVRVAPTLIAQADTTHQAYDKLVDLLNRQPTLGVRSSTSVLQQAYSTPIPIAYLASTLAGITPETTVYEPTAGNGALLIGVNPAQVIANELNGDRFAELGQRGYHQLTQFDASQYRPAEAVDVVITNPPFGPVHDDNGRIKRFEIPGNRRGTRQIDHAIALKALEAMKDNGCGVLILGGKLGADEDLRSNRYNSIESRGFFYALYQQYNVTQHISVWGDLYRKQGAGFPIDLIVIEGRGQASRDLPAADVPLIYQSFDALKELLPNEPVQQQTTGLSGLRQLSIRLESRSWGSGIVDGQDPTGDDPDERAGLQATDDPANPVDDSHLDGAQWRGSGADASQVGSSLEEPLPPGISQFVRERRDPGTRTPVVVDAGVGRDISGAQRDISSSVSRDRDRFSNLSADRPSGNGVGMGGSPRQFHPGELALQPDLWHDQRLSLNPNTEARIRPMAITEQEHLTSDAPLNVAYIPRSQGRTPGTLIPANMATAAQIALDKLEQTVGDVDAFVQQRLGYESKEQMWRYLYAEQIDANALAFWQRDREKVFLNGDQTGNGKGRFCASQIVDAINQGYIPVFVTQKPNLYVSMLEDLVDIGKPEVRIFTTNSKMALDLPDGTKLKPVSSEHKQAEMQQILERGMGGYNAVFTTYSQLQTVQSEEPFRRDFLRQIASKAIFIFDEAHEAGGSTGEKGWKSASDPPDRSEFVRELIDRSAGAVFASATAVKDPAVMDLYARRSDATAAVTDISSLQRTLKEGGVPLQQMMATKFVASGQMLRRERSFEGVTFAAKTVGVDREVADNISSIMRAISQFDLAKEKAVQKLSKQLKKEAKAASEDNSIGQTGARSTNFTSLMNNAIDQGLLCQKAEATVQETLAAISRGQKPVIAVANTMEAFIKQYSDENGLKPGDAINISFGDVLSRYLERSRDVTIKDHEGNAVRRRMMDDELGDEALAAYESARELTDETDLSSIPLSSIDYIKWRLTAEGVRVDEITGRQHRIDYTSSGEQGYGYRSGKEVTPKAKVETVSKFNSGELDVLILNRSGATGINLHASEKFADQQQRHLIMAQAERDINQVMQMLGRVNRFGQVVEPEITLLMSDLPAEKRLGAILSKKMATLNANTTADRESALSVSNVVDFLNPYGEEVITEILEDNPELEAKLAFPSEGLKGETDTELIGRVTGRIPLLSVKEQEELYSLIESETLDLIAQKQAMGESVLEAQQLDLDARTIAQMEVIPDEATVRNEFTGPVYLEVVDAKIPVKPFSQLEVINTVRENLGLERVKDATEHDFGRAEEAATQQTRQQSEELRQATRQYRSEMLPSKHDNYSRDKLTERLNSQYAHVSHILKQFPPGRSVRVVSPEGNITYGVVAKIFQKGHNGSPAAPTNWKAQILTDNHARILTIPLTRFNRGKEGKATTITAQETNWEGQDIYAAFDLRQKTERLERQIFQGNLLKAYEKYPNGKFLNYTDHTGGVRQGLIMPASFDIQESLRNEPVTFRDPRQVKAFLTEVTAYQGSVKTLDEVLTLKPQAAARFGSTAAGFVLQTPKSAIGDRFSLDQDIIAACGSDFYSVSDRMEVVVPSERIDRVLDVLMTEQGYALAAFDFKDKAREFLGVKLPELQVITEEATEVVEVEAEQLDSPAPTPEETPAIQEPTVPLILVDPIEDDFSKQPQPMPPAQLEEQAILPAREQTGGAERNVAKLLHEAGLASLVLTGEDFHLRIENEPYIPLVIERHGNQLYLTHYLEQNGDTFIDSEMVFGIHSSGRLQFQETAVQNPFQGGESRYPDRGFAQLFSRNLLRQEFAQATRETLAKLPAETQREEPEAERPHTVEEGIESEPPIASEPDTPIVDKLDVVLVTTTEQLAQTVDRFSAVERLAIDTETSGLDPHQDTLELIQLAAPGQPVTIIQCANFTPEELQPLNQLFGSEAEKVIQNASFDLQMLKSIGLEVKGPIFDTMLASQIIDAGLNQSHKLEAIAHRYLGIDLDKTEQKSDWGSELTESQVQYAAKDAAVLLPLRDTLAERLEAKGLTETASLEFRAAISVAEMEWNGMAINRENLQTWAQTLREQKARLEPEIQALLQQSDVIQPSLLGDNPPAINLESSKQLLPALQQLGIPVTNTRKETLIPLQEQYPVVAQLLEYRRTTKALSTYAEGYEKLIHPATGRLHPHINQCGAVTGRFSCTSPNLQNVPRDPRIKGCFEPAPGNVLIKADYSQIELRTAAQVSGESRMKEAYRKGQDLHALTASLLLHKSVNQVTKDERRLAKAVNFGLIYGMQAQGFQIYAKTQYDVPLTFSQAQKHRDQFFKAYPGLIDWHDRVKAEQANSCRTLGGRLRQWEDEAPFTEIINAPVQGTSADITKLAIAQLPENLQGTGAKLLMQVHDEIVLEVPVAQADRAGQILVQTMVAAGQQFLKEVPVEVEAVICNNWAGLNARPVTMLEVTASVDAVEPKPNPSQPMNEAVKQLAATVRELPLDQVAQHLGLTQDKRDAQKWTNEGHTISLYNNNHSFSDWATEVTGKYGAIDLVMHVQGSSYKEAVSWLAETQNLTPVIQPAEPPKRAPSCNVRDESQWQAVEQYLAEERKLPPEIITSLHQQGIIAADSRQNVMFFRHELLDSFECGEAIGANLRGTLPNSDGEYFKGLTPGTRREDGFFWIQQGEGVVDRVVLTESPIDTISFAAMDESRETGATVYLSTDGRGAIPVTAIGQVLDQGGELILAQDNDPDGNRQAWSIVQQFPEYALIRVQPEGYKDWNDCLRDSPQSAWEGQAESDGLWNWYGVAKTEERSGIAQVATEFLAPKNPRSLTDAELEAIAQATNTLQNSQTNEVIQTPEAIREAELARGQEILDIAERAYAFGEQIGHLQFDGEFWTVKGHQFDIGYNPDNDNFFAIGKGESQMTAQRIGQELDPNTTGDVSVSDFQAFQETDAALTKLGVHIQQSPAETVAIAQAKLEALAVKGQEPQLDQASPSTDPTSQTNEQTQLVWEQSDPSLNSTEPISLGKPSSQPTLDEVRLWYVQARDIGQSDRYLKRIEEVGKALAQEQQPLSEKALQAMAKDQAKWIAQVETVVDHAQTILALKGEPMAGGTFYGGKQCLLFERDGYLVATAPSRGVQPSEGDRQQLPTEMLSWGRGLVLKVEQNTIDCGATRITNSDATRFERFAKQVRADMSQSPQAAGYEH